MNHRLVIDPGHGGRAPGLVREVGGKKLVEAEANLQSALTLKYILKDVFGFPYDILLTRTENKTISWGSRMIPATLSVAIHYDIDNGGIPIYYQKGRCDSFYVAERLRILTGYKHPVWSTRRAAHTGGRLYIDDAKHPFVLWEVDQLINYEDSREWRVKKFTPIAKAIVEVFNDLVRGL